MSAFEVMRRADTARYALALGLSLAGCEAPESDTWTRALASWSPADEDRPIHYYVAHYDPLARTCVTFTLTDKHSEFLSSPVDYDENDEVELDLRGIGGYVLVGAYGRGDQELHTAAEACDVPTYGQAGDTIASGTIRFGKFKVTDGKRVPCEISFELDIENPWDGERFEARADDRPILSPGCLEPPGYAVDHSELDAAYGEYGALDNLVVASWDAQREVCVWARFLRDEQGVVSPSEVESPWAYSGLRFGWLGREGCVASELIVPPAHLGKPSPDYPALGSSGQLKFVRDEDGLPCSLDVDLRLESPGLYYWTPDELRLRASELSVHGACGNP